MIKKLLKFANDENILLFLGFICIISMILRLLIILNKF